LITRENLKLGIPDKFFIITDNIVIVTVAELTSIPLLIYASRICPKNLEGTMYAVITSVNNFGGMIGGLLGGVLTNKLGISHSGYIIKLDFSNLWMICVISNCFILFPLILLFKIDFEHALKVTDKTYKIQEDDENKNLLAD